MNIGVIKKTIHWRQDGAMNPELSILLRNFYVAEMN